MVTQEGFRELVVFVGGTFMQTHTFAANRSAIVKPLSAITESPGSKMSSSPLLIERGNADTKLIAPDGVIPISALKVL